MTAKYSIAYMITCWHISAQDGLLAAQLHVRQYSTLLSIAHRSTSQPPFFEAPSQSCRQEHSLQPHITLFFSQDGLSSIVPHITTRKVSVSVQDFCNLLGGGLVSLSTLHPDTLVALAGLSSGAVICEYKYRKADVLKVLPGTTEGEEVAGVKEEEEDEQFDAPVIFAELPTKSKEADVKDEVVATDPDVMQVEQVQDVESAVEEEDECKCLPIFLMYSNQLTDVLRHVAAV